jgi:two-component system response regulator NreC
VPIHILIVDDHGAVRDGLRALLKAEADLEVVGEAAEAEEALELIPALRPDLVLMDLSLPGDGGIVATRRLKEMWPDLQVLVLTLHEDQSLLREAIRVGAGGYILKRAAVSDLVGAIRVVSRGDLYVHPALAGCSLADAGVVPPVDSMSPEALTPQEINVLCLIAQGYTTRQAAELLVLSMCAVEDCLASLMEKLDLHGRVELARYAAQHGLLQPGALWSQASPFPAPYAPAASMPRGMRSDSSFEPQSPSRSWPGYLSGLCPASQFLGA